MRPLHYFIAATTVALLPGGGSALAQAFGSPSISKMTAAYDPSLGSVVLSDSAGAQAPSTRLLDPAVQQAAVFQPTGRVYGVSDPYAASGPQTVAPPTATYGAPAYGAPAPGAPVYGAPAYGAPAYGAPAYPPPACPPPSYGACPPMDAYSCGPNYAAPQAVTFASAARQPYAGIGASVGDPAETLDGNLVLPFWQQPDSFWFFDLRGQYDDERAGEGNFGVARRQLLSPNQIMGWYGFYDLRHSEYNNNFQQMTLGFEMLSLDWEYRFNGYLPFTGTQTTGQNIASIDPDDNIVVQQGLERAYWGFDGEYGNILTRFSGANDHELRWFVGGYYFDTSAEGFESFGGPRARLEGRFYALPLLGAGSRFTYGVGYQYDSLRDSQWTAAVNLRIPFGSGRAACSKLSPIERRMMDSIRREPTIVTAGAFGAPEQAVITSNGLVATNVTQVNSATPNVPAAVAAGTGIVVVTSNVNTNAPVVLNPNQFLGGQFAVHGQNTGAAATFGQRTTINATGADAVRIADNSTVTGLNITGNQNGIVGGAPAGGVSGFIIDNNTVTVSGGDAIRLEGTVHGDIIGNTFRGSDDGLDIDTYASGQISGNTATGTGAGGDGFEIDSMTGGSLSGNTATGSGGNGYSLTIFSGGTISGNTASGNQGLGYAVFGLVGGTLNGNTATGNQAGGFGVGGMSAGLFSDNQATNNQGDGYQFQFAVTGGTISGNTATTNAGDGFQFASISGATANVNTNTATGNTGDGFNVVIFSDGVFNTNVANNNTGMGYNFPANPPVPPASAMGNTGADNGSVDVFP